MSSRRASVANVLASAAIGLAGCSVQVEETYDPIPTNVPSTVPLEIRYTGWEPWSSMFVLRAQPDGTTSCETILSSFYETVTVECAFRATVENGRWQLYTNGSLARETYVPSFGYGASSDNLSLLDRSARLAVQAPGYRRGSVSCFVQDDGGTTVSHRQRQRCAVLNLLPTDGTESTLTRAATGAGPGAELTVEAAASNDFPYRIALSGSLPFVTGRVRADEDCPLVSRVGVAATSFSRSQDNGLVRVRADIDPSLLDVPSAAWRLSVQHDSPVAIGDVLLSATVTLRRRGETWTYAPSASNTTQAGGTGSDWQALDVGANGRIEIVDAAGSGFAGHCQSDLVRVVSLGSRPSTGRVVSGDAVEIDVRFSSPVVVQGGVPTLTLETGTNDRFATYVRGSGTDTLTFAYTVQAGDVSPQLDAHGATALSPADAMLGKPGLEGGVDLRLPTPGSAGSLGASGTLAVGG